MWANLKACGALLVALGLAAGCGKTGTSESGETHFVTCNTDSDCTGVRDAHTCSGGFCRGPANADHTPPDETPACDGGCGDSQCATPGTCSLAAACTLTGCDNYLMDGNACVRPACQDDSGCPDDERCTTTWLSNHYECAQNGDVCECQAGLGLFPINICSPVTMVGVRGQWQKLVVTENIIGDATVRTIAADGSITIEQRSLETGMPVTSTAQLSPDDLDELTRLVNGPFFRASLAEPAACPITKARDDIVDLYLGDAPGIGSANNLPTLSKNVAGCLSPPDEIVEFSKLIDLVSKY